MIKDNSIFRGELEKANNFWFSERVEEEKKYPVKREELGEIKEYLKLKKISVISGPRRCGKSVIIKHLISELIKKGVKPRNILYYSLEDPYLKIYCDNLIHDSFDYWNKNISQEGEKYVFYDEIHFIDKWYEWLKVLYDKNKEIKIVISGSSSLNMQQEVNKYLRGRYILHHIWPLSFKQFLKFKGKEIKNIDFNQLNQFEASKLMLDYEKDFREFLIVGGFPEYLEIKDKKKWFEILKSFVSNKSIYEDIATTFKIRNVKILEEIFLYIISNQSKILSYEKINEIAKLKHEILLNYIEYLKFSNLIIEILKYSGNIKEQLKSKKKFLCVDQGLRNSLLKVYEIREDNEGALIENIVGVHCYVQAFKKEEKIMYYRTDKTYEEVDFVVKNDKNILIEAKYREKISDEYISKIIKISKDIGFKKVYIVTKDELKTIKKDDIEVVLMPALIFCLFIEKFIYG